MTFTSIPRSLAHEIVADVMQRANAGCKRAAGSGARRASGEDSTVAGPIRVTRKLGRAAQLLFQHPLQRFALVALVVGSYLRVHEHPDYANQPTLPVVCDDDCGAFYFLLVIFYEPSMISKGCNILPAVESRSVNQQSDFPVLTDHRIDLRRNLAEVVRLQFRRCRDPQYVVGNDFCLDHVKPPQT